MARLGDISTVITKGTTPTSIGFNFQNDGINFVKIESVDENGSFICEKFDHISTECHEKLKRSQLQENDILFSIAGAIGRTAIVTKDILPANTNQALAIIRIPQGAINYAFLLYILQSSVVLEQAEKKKQGVAQLNLSLKDIGDFVIPDIPLEKQQEIVDNLNKVSNLISLRKRQLSKLDELVKSRFIELFGDPRINPKGYDIVPISSLFDVGSSKRVFESEWRESGVAFYRAREIVKLSKDGHVDNELFIEEEMYEAYKAKYGVPKAGDMMVTGVGTLGVCYIVKETDRFYFKDGNTLWFKNKGLCDVRFIKDQYDTDFVKEQITANANVSTVGTYTITNANNTLILLPSLAEQEQYVEFCKQTDKSKFEIQKSLEKLETLKKALMQKYFG